jgi:hypothetical protein
LLTNPSNEILSEISKIYDLNFEYVELGIEGPEGNPQLINKKKNEIVRLLQKFKHKPIAHTAYWIDLCSDYDYIRHAWILEAMRQVEATNSNGKYALAYSIAHLLLHQYTSSTTVYIVYNSIHRSPSYR